VTSPLRPVGVRLRRYVRLLGILLWTGIHGFRKELERERLEASARRAPSEASELGFDWSGIERVIDSLTPEERWTALVLLKELEPKIRAEVEQGVPGAAQVLQTLDPMRQSLMNRFRN
jgi:hypothetical protein